jgi:transcription initiation factor TFIID TATA-box-binding protein
MNFVEPIYDGDGSNNGDIKFGGFLNDPLLRSLPKELLVEDPHEFNDTNASLTSVTTGISHDFTNRALNFDFVGVKKRIQIVKPKLFIQNVVSCVQISRQLDKNFILSRSGGTIYAKKSFAALIHKRPKTTALIFTTGKLVITGAKSEAESEMEANMHIDVLRKIYKDDDNGFTGINFKIHNIVASGTTSYPISLSKLNSDHKLTCQYEPEDFPGVIYRMNNFNITFLIFASGKIVIAGGKSVANIEESFRLIVEILENYKQYNPQFKKHKK